MAETVTATTETTAKGNDWFSTFIGAAERYLVARETAETQQQVITTIPYDSNTGAVPYQPIVGGAAVAQKSFSVPTEYLWVGGALVVAVVLVRVL